MFFFLGRLEMKSRGGFCLRQFFSSFLACLSLLNEEISIGDDEYFFDNN